MSISACVSITVASTGVCTVQSLNNTDCSMEDTVATSPSTSMFVILVHPHLDLLLCPHLVPVFHPQTRCVTSPGDHIKLMRWRHHIFDRSTELAVQGRGTFKVFLLLELVDGGAQLLDHHDFALELW